ncbi:MAG TPA: hypothetical protein DDW73_14885 [Rhizobium sp.]|nr:hypothetical protein [Rhizobium sp.]
MVSKPAQSGVAKPHHARLQCEKMIEYVQCQNENIVAGICAFEPQTKMPYFQRKFFHLENASIRLDVKVVLVL